MDFADERYVRLYTRNTTTWRRLEWEGQCMLAQLLRCVDRAGLLEIEDMSPVEAAILHTGGPPAFVEKGISRMLELGVLVHRGTTLLFPRFIEAQETAKTDRARQRESREKRRDLTKSRHDESQNVTESHEPSQTVTVSHSESQPVTPCCAVLNRSVPNYSVPSVPDTVPANLSQNVTPIGLASDDAVAALDEPAAAGGDVIHMFRQPLGEAPPGLAPSEPELWCAIVRIHCDEYQQKRPGVAPKRADQAAKTLATWCEQHAKVYRCAPLELAKRVIAGLFGCPKAAAKRWPLGFAAHDPEEYAGSLPGEAPLPKPPAKTQWRGRSGPAPVSRHEDFVEDAARIAAGESLW
jgi:hypothetical protein